MDTKFFDSLYEGDSPIGVKLGMGLTGGDFWPRVAGCQMLYRGPSMELIDFASPLAVTEIEASETSPPIYFPHNSGTVYFYVIRRANNCGAEEQTLAAAVKVSIDTSGELAESQPNNIFEARAEQLEGDKIRLVWYYYPIEQHSPPACFNIYYDAGAGKVDYENQIATISYAGRQFYSYYSDTLDADRYMFAIRAEDAGGMENSSLAQLKVHLDTTTPGIINILGAKAV